MKKLIAIILLTIISTASYAWTQRPPLPVASCSIHTPYGLPDSSTPVKFICREGYLSAYDSTAKIPKVVTYTLRPENVLGCVVRSNGFDSDQSIANGPTPQDYTGTGYDKGHLAPDGDMSYSKQVEYESFLMTNMTPQAPSLNRGIWKLLETSVRSWVLTTNQSFTIYAGGVYNSKDKKIGSGVVVPRVFYKIVINNQTGEVAAWAFPHDAPYGNLGTNLIKFRTSVEIIERETGIKFYLPSNANELLPSLEWQTDFGYLTEAKRKKCGNTAKEE